MVVIQPKSPYPLLLFVLLCFSSGLLSLGYQIPRYRTDIDRCIDQCREEVEDVSGLFSCAVHCDRKYAGTEWEPEGFERQLQQCQEHCQSKERGGKQQQQCQRRCVEQERERKQERERAQRESEREKREREHHRERREREEREQQEEEEEEKERGEQREEEQEERQQQETERQRELERREEEQEEIERQREREREEREQREEEQEEREQQREREREEREQREEEQEEIERQRKREREARERDRERERETISRDYYSRDPEEEYKECQQLCKKQPATQEPQCKRRCKRQYEDIKGIQLGKNHHEPQQQYEQCRKLCERQERGEQHQQQCKSWCEQQREKEERRRKHEQNPQREEQQQRNNPYYFQAQRFQYRFRSQEGHIKVLQRFSERSELLLGIDNYRLVIAEANPSTLLVPHHSDAENFLVVVRGRGIVTLVSQERRESFNMEHGDVLRISAGTTAYLVNQDNNEKLQLFLLTHPVNTPGRFREYFAAGGGNPESYYRVFSHDILQRALNTPSDQLERLFEGERRQHGVIRRATPEQLKALSQHPSQKQPGTESSGPFNLLRRKPLYHNNFGRFFEVTPNDYKQLQETGVSVAYVEINQGAMMVPHYNSKTTTIVLVVEGRGLLEMGCPHLSRQGQGSQEKREQTEEEGESSGQLQKITVQLSPGDVFIIPAGHPIALVAQNENLRTVGFGINALNNQRNFLAGKINIMNQVEREAMEIAFNVPARLVERIFSNNPKESYFVAGPELAGPEEEQREDGRRHLLPSVMDLAGFF